MIHFRSFSAEDWIEFQEITKEAFAREGITKEGYLQTIENAELRILTTQDYETVVNTFPATNKEELKSHLTDEQSVGFTGVESIPLGLFVDNKLQIYGRFNPEFPGCRPFLVLDTEYFEEFIARLKPHKRKDFIRLTFDGDSKLAKFFQERGYLLWHHLWFMQRENREK